MRAANASLSAATETLRRPFSAGGFEFMDPQRSRHLEEIYQAAFQLPPSERSAYLATVCGDDAALRAEIESRLASDPSSADLLETKIFDGALRLLTSDGAPQSSDLNEVRTRKALTGVRIDGRYRIERELGQGGIGVVYLAHDEKLHNKPVVIKLLLETSQAHKWFVQKFQQEKEALARVDHPGVVGILDAGELPEGEPYIVMQFVDGISLRDAIKNDPEGLELPRVASIIKQATSALNAVHTKRICHRDLKPENIMLQPLGPDEEQVKILDFGVAKVKESLIGPSTATGGVSAGTVIYMSPEQLRGDRVTAMSDIYSLGLIAYELVTGRRPFKPDTVAQLSDMQREGVRVKPSDLRPRLPLKAEAAILRALNFDPVARPQTATEFGEAFSDALLEDDEDSLKFTQPTQVDVVAPRPDVIPVPANTIKTPSPRIYFGVAEPNALLPVARKRTWPKLLAVVAAAVLVIGGFLIVMNRERLFGHTSAAESRASLTYFLTVQKMRDGKPYQEPFQSSGQEIFENGYHFRLNVTTPRDGYLYVFNEGADENGAVSFTIIYPTPATNSGSAKIDANTNITTNWNTFGGKPGTEQFWIVWSSTSESVLEAARDTAFKSEKGAIADAAMVRTVREFLTTHSDPKAETTKDTARKETHVSGTGDVLVKMVELEHR
jgi:eukaryotic-like serine/threonine-protein kinase